MKETRRTNYRVEVTPEEPWFMGELTESDRHQARMSACEEVELQIRKRCDDVSGVSIKYDTEETCSHCGSVWEDNPECCEEAIKEWLPEGTGNADLQTLHREMTTPSSSNAPDTPGPDLPQP